MAKITSKKDNTINVGHFKIVVGRSYVVENKPDDFQKEYRDKGLTKFPFKGNGEIHQVPFDETVMTYNTGFDISDSVNKSKFITKEDVANAVKLIKIPFETFYKKNLDPTNDSFWLEDKLSMVELYPNKVFDTNNIRDLLHLYLALKHYWVVVKGDNDSKTLGVGYRLVDQETQIDEATKAAAKPFDAIAKFIELTANEKGKEKLFTVLDWTGLIKNSRHVNIEQVKQQFQINSQRLDFCTKFLDAIEQYESKPDVRQEMENYSSLLLLQNDRKIQYERGKYYIDGILIGNSLKEGAKILMEPDSTKGKLLTEAVTKAFEQ